MTRVKVCGIMDQQNAEVCIEAGVDAVGLIVEYPLSVPWNIKSSEARQLVNGLPPFVSTFVVTGGSADHILAVAREVQPDIIQVHFQETWTEVRTVTQQLRRYGIKSIKALSIDHKGQCAFEIPDPIKAAQALAETGIAALLIDSFRQSLPGGTGVTVDGSIFHTIQQSVNIPVILAGGLTPDNVGPLIEKHQPYAVDVLTGVEIKPGQKDRKRLRRFMQSVKQVDLKLEKAASEPKCRHFT
jgi:phosphoribosylanthranilate isomerase